MGIFPKCETIGNINTGIVVFDTSAGFKRFLLLRWNLCCCQLLLWFWQNKIPRSTMEVSELVELLCLKLRSPPDKTGIDLVFFYFLHFRTNKIVRFAHRKISPRRRNRLICLYVIVFVRCCLSAVWFSAVTLSSMKLEEVSYVFANNMRKCNIRLA